MNLRQIYNQFGNKEVFFNAVNEKLRELCNEQPEFVYTFESNNGNNDIRCKYNGPPEEMVKDSNGKLQSTICGPESKGCIFGQAFQRMGWDDVSEMGINCGIRSLLDNYTLISYDFVPESWTIIQTDQDRGTKWGDLLPLIT